ncbi:MAG: helicase-related protein [Bacteroidales bacterium]
MAIDAIKPGNLVTLRGRDWIVLPSDDADLLIVKPLSGSDEEITAIYKPLQIQGDKIEKAQFDEPSEMDIDDFESAKMLFDATRLSFRNASGPFRCMGKLSFRPRSYQLVPLVMALKQELVRLLIADDVGIGKTVEALIILKEMMERGEIKRFAVICLPHLCEQWQQELRDKLDIEAEIIRSSTAASLDRKLPDDQSVFYHIPYQVISIDYIKADKRRGVFLNDCPELVIVDEAHTCARPKGSKSLSQQQRFHLLHDIAARENQHLLLLTATPHSGKDEEFQSLLGLLKPEFAKLDFTDTDQNLRRQIARHFIQRKRESIRRWLHEETIFPERESKEVAYELSKEYADFYTNMLRFAKGISLETKEKRGSKIRHWTALALLRGVMSSPAAGLEMLKNRQNKHQDNIDNELSEAITSLDRLESDSDITEVDLMEQVDFDSREINELNNLTVKIEQLHGLAKDFKARMAIDILKDWLKRGFHPIVFCRYIATAKYFGKILREILPSSVNVQIITSTLPDEDRRKNIALMGNEAGKQRIMVATDCLSEGINLQDQFTAVFHYDLPWNPNRIEQREGRVDRYGQASPKVLAYLLWGKDNPIDSIVLKVLINKVRDIQRATGVAISLGDDNKSIMDAVLTEVLLDPDEIVAKNAQTTIDFGVELRKADTFFTNELDQVRVKAESLRSIFAHESIRPESIEADLKEVDEAIGDVTTVENFVKAAILHLGGGIIKDSKGYILDPMNLPDHIKARFNGRKKINISFESPTPQGYQYIGRNHTFVEQLCHFLMSLAFEKHQQYRPIARASVIQTDKVQSKTTLIQFRVRNVIREKKRKREVISEEMYLWGYSGSAGNSKALDYSETKNLLLGAVSINPISIERQSAIFLDEKTLFNQMKQDFNKLAEERAIHLVEAHSRFKELVGGFQYEAVYPVLPPDVLGVYILIPKPKDLF